MLTIFLLLFALTQALEFKASDSTKLRVHLYARDAEGELLNELAGVKDKRTTDAVAKLLFLFGEVNKIDRMASAASSGMASKTDVLLGSAVIEEVPAPSKGTSEWVARVMLVGGGASDGKGGSSQCAAAIDVKLKVSFLLCTVTFYANLAHSLPRSP